MDAYDIYNYVMNHPNYTYDEKMDFSMIFLDAQINLNWRAIRQLRNAQKHEKED